LARRDVAIVSPLAGTTRDILEAHLDIDGLAVVVADTAGLRQSDNAIEAEGVRRARDWATAADVRVLVIDRGGLDDLEDSRDAETADIVIVNKADLGPRTGTCPVGAVDVSTTDGHGIAAFLEQLSAVIQKGFAASGSVVATRARHRQGIAHSHAALVDFAEVFKDDRQIDLAAEDLRLAVRALGQLTGRVDVEDLLDVIFSDFCIGK
jgi:tRNA modification GTPase